jgi:hypothetical protein
MGSRRIALLLLMLGPILNGGRVEAQPTVPEQAVPVFLPAPLRWDTNLLSFHPALNYTATDFVNLTNGIAFGMSAVDLNAKLPDPYPGMSWNALTLASEYPGEVRYFGIPIEAAGALRMGATACTGAGSYLVFLFRPAGLFRLSYRLVADKSCPDTNAAAQQIFGRFVPIAQQVSLSVRYRHGKTEVVDITDPAAGYLTPIRWRQGGS